MPSDDLNNLSKRIEQLNIERKKDMRLDLQKEKQPIACNIVMEILAYLIVVVIIGCSIDKMFDSSPFSLIITTCVGSIAGFKNIMSK